MKIQDSQSQKKDHLPIAVFCILILLLFVTAFFSYKSVKEGILFERIIRFERDLQRGLSRFKIPGITDTERNDFQRLRNAGHRHFRKRQWDEAIKKYSEAIQLRPQSYSIYYWRARAYLNKGDKKSAIKDLKKSIEIKSSFYNAYDLLGWIYTEEREWKEGIRYLNVSISLRPDNGWAYYTRGRCYYYLGIQKRALEDVKKACELGYRDACTVYERLKKGA